MRYAFPIILAIITITSACIVGAHIWWLPASASAHGADLDEQFASTFLETGVAFVLSQLMLAFFVWRYAETGSGRKMRIFPGGAKGPVLTAFLLVGLELIGLEVMGAKVWARLYYQPAQQNAIRAYVSAEQFGFYFRFPGPDGKFGTMHPDHIDPSTGNFFGLNKQDEVEARDDIVTGELKLPVNREAELILHSKDVGHSFYVPELRIQNDFLPGIDIPIHFTPTKIGKYMIVCTQLCGLGHYSMKAPLEILSQEDYDKWLQEQAAAQ